MDNYTINIAAPPKKSRKPLHIAIAILILSGIFTFVYIGYERISYNAFVEGIDIMKVNSSKSYYDALDYFNSYTNNFPIGKYNNKAKDLVYSLYTYTIYNNELTSIKDSKSFGQFQEFMIIIENYVYDAIYIHDIAYDYVFNGNTANASDIVNFSEARFTDFGITINDLMEKKNDYLEYISSSDMETLSKFISCGLYPSLTIRDYIVAGKIPNEEIKNNLYTAWTGYDETKSLAQSIISDKKAMIERQTTRAAQLVFKIEQIKSEINYKKII